MAAKSAERASTDAKGPGQVDRRDRYERKRDALLGAATTLINDRGAKATTLQAVSQAVQLSTTSVTYYFPRKDVLAAAVFERAMERLRAMVDTAAQQPTPRERVSCLLALHVRLRADVIRGRDVPIATLSEVRTLDEDIRRPLLDQYVDLFRATRALWGEFPTRDKPLMTARAHLLQETVFWLPVWLTRFPIDEFRRVHAQLFDLLENGLAMPGTRWSPAPLPPGSDQGEQTDAESVPGGSGVPNFLGVATRLINEAGYRGASVVKIVDELEVTKGSFYHHLDAKDDLILECFRRSFKRISTVQCAAQRVGATQWEHLEATMATLMDLQFEGEFPLTRTSALQALPLEVRADVVARSDRTALRYGNTLIEGAQEGSIRLVNPLIASQTIAAMLNSAYDLRNWAAGMDRASAIRLYASCLTRGLFADPAAILGEA
ncbi:TetR family transcriptional regulator [Erythrobacter arachoides]|uniref:TetR family transcriptional regulator n=1 Tax=Aurantiacibacter arachoides TaxID=1850444 RepID=A0A845A0U5_9SPHN|nr:TetR family transcriptional regulator [Aurantiacibacter arachoides]MXO94123.1 TetR family transcriptional regulator [Aurantiacibacter arachoides]GGD65869.1 TetR family transcriptional regulator [Aurantiacibacter arachoides]